METDNLVYNASTTMSRILLSNKVYWYGSFSSAILTLGVLLLLLRTWIVDTVIYQELVLGPNKTVTESWRTPPVPMFLDFYLFNWTNPDEINDPSTKPHFEEIGPYRFIEKKDKVNITWNSNSTVTYRLLNYWYFDDEGSPRKLTDRITTIDVMMLMASKEVRDWSYWAKKGIAISLATLGNTLHVTKTAKELLFDGYQDKFLDTVQTFSFLSDKKFPDKVGFLYGRNGSYTHNGVFNVATGAEGNSGELLNWKYKDNTNMYSGDCNKIHGSALDLFQQRLTKTFVDIFTTETCSTFRLRYENDASMKGVDGYKYSAGEKLFDNGTLVPENECFLQGEGLPSGLLNITRCAGVELYASLPHMYGADPVYFDMIDGLAPDKEKHDTFFTIEPRVGVALDVAFRLQTQFLLEPIQYFTMFENVPRVFIPTLWFEQKYVIPDHLASSIRLLNNLPLIISIVAGVLIVVGIAILMSILITHLRLNTNISAKVVQLNFDATNQSIAVENKLKQEFFV